MKTLFIDSESVSVVVSKSVSVRWWTSLTQVYSVCGSTLVTSIEIWSEGKRRGVKVKDRYFVKRGVTSDPRGVLTKPRLPTG